MAITSNLFQSAADQFIQGAAQWKAGGHAIKMALLTSAATPNLSTWVTFSNVNGEVSGTGYTAGGVTLTSVSDSGGSVAANSWPTSWAASTAATLGQVIKPATGNGFLYICVVAGTSGTGGGPSFPTVVGQTVVDNTITWSCLGESITVYTSSSAAWPSSSITARYAVIYDASTGSAASEPLICLINFGTDQTDSSGTFTVSPDTQLGWFWTSPA